MPHRRPPARRVSACSSSSYHPRPSSLPPRKYPVRHVGILVAGGCTPVNLNPDSLGALTCSRFGSPAHAAGPIEQIQSDKSLPTGTPSSSGARRPQDLATKVHLPPSSLSLSLHPSTPPPPRPRLHPRLRLRPPRCRLHVMWLFGQIKVGQAVSLAGGSSSRDRPPPSTSAISSL